MGKKVKCLYYVIIQSWNLGPVLSPRKHGRGWGGAAPASDAVARASVQHLSFFFFSDSCRLGSICPDVARFVPNRLRFAPNRADSAKIGPYRPYRVVLADGRYGRNRSETAEIGLEYGRKSRNLLSSFFFL